MNEEMLAWLPAYVQLMPLPPHIFSFLIQIHGSLPFRSRLTQVAMKESVKQVSVSAYMRA